jgi:hypothetical protein
LREDVSDIYESVATPDAPIPAKSDTSHRTRAIWFNDLNKKYSFNGCFGQGKISTAHVLRSCALQDSSSSDDDFC